MLGMVCSESWKMVLAKFKVNQKVNQLGSIFLAVLWLSMGNVSSWAQSSPEADLESESTEAVPAIPSEPGAEPAQTNPIIPPAPVLEVPPLNPLEPQPDPLIPEMAVDRPLNPQEQAVLQEALNELRRQGQASLEAGDLPGALELWNRELRLRRYLGPKEEVASLARVGRVAWQQSQATELRYITLRLEQIEQEILPPPDAETEAPATQPAQPVDWELLASIAEAYEQVRARDQAVALYSTLLNRARQQENTARQQEILIALGNQHISWFDYPAAATAYEDLLTLSRATGNQTSEIESLTQLAYIYQENNQPEQAIAVQQQLVDTYQQQQNFVPIPAIKIAMADSYVLLNQPGPAATNYQEAFAVARSVQQFAYASDALQKLATLYQSLNRPADALIVYQLLLDVERQSYNTFGMMNTYDQLGQLYKAQGDASQALAAFRQGLQIARQLKYRVDYFNTQIQEVNPQN
jgi:tetratricopeptide (TPR) repeat protein